MKLYTNSNPSWCAVLMLHLLICDLWWASSASTMSEDNTGLDKAPMTLIHYMFLNLFLKYLVCCYFIYFISIFQVILFFNYYHYLFNYLIYFNNIVYRDLKPVKEAPHKEDIEFVDDFGFSAIAVIIFFHFYYLASTLNNKSQRKWWKSL